MPPATYVERAKDAMGRLVALSGLEAFLLEPGTAELKARRCWGAAWGLLPRPRPRAVPCLGCVPAGLPPSSSCCRLRRRRAPPQDKGPTLRKLAAEPDMQQQLERSGIDLSHGPHQRLVAADLLPRQVAAPLRSRLGVKRAESALGGGRSPCRRAVGARRPYAAPLPTTSAPPPAPPHPSLWCRRPCCRPPQPWRSRRLG